MAPDAEHQDSNNQIVVDEGYEVQVEGEEDDEQQESGRHYEEPDGDEEEQEYGDEQYQDPNQPEMDEDDIDDEHDDEARQHYQYDQEQYSEGEEGEDQTIEIGAEQLEALLRQHERRQRGEDPGEPILDENGDPIELTDEEYQEALAQF